MQEFPLDKLEHLCYSKVVAAYLQSTKVDFVLIRGANLAAGSVHASFASFFEHANLQFSEFMMSAYIR